MLSNVGNMNDIFEGLVGEVDSEIITSLGELRDIAFIKSFTEQKNDILMWGHYGEQYARMCVEYDFSELKDAVLYHLFPIIYSDNRYHIKTLGNAIDDLYQLKKANKENYYPDFSESLFDIMALFLRKSSSWKNEKEWRIVAAYLHIHDETEDFYGIKNGYKLSWFGLNDKIISVKNCIKAVYIGPRMQKMQREHIKEICSELKDVKVYELVISKSKYGFEEKEVLKENK